MKSSDKIKLTQEKLKSVKTKITQIKSRLDQVSIRLEKKIASQSLPVGVYKKNAKIFLEKGDFQKAILMYCKAFERDPFNFGDFSDFSKALYNVYSFSQDSIYQGLKSLLEENGYDNQLLIERLEQLIKLGFIGKREASTNPTVYYVINHQLGIIYCSIPKNACTLFKTMMLENSNYASTFDQFEGNAHVFWGKHKIRADIADLYYHIDQYYKFVVIRNPFERLVSGYLDKIAKKRSYIEPFAKSVVQNVYNFLNLEVDFEKSITFSQFVEYLWRTSDRDLDYHWRPQVTFLGHISFDAIFDFNNIASSIESLKNKFNLEVSTDVSDPSHITKYMNYNENRKFHCMYPPELRNLKAMPTSANMYTSDLAQIVRLRYAEDIKIYEDSFNVKLNEVSLE